MVKGDGNSDTQLDGAKLYRKRNAIIGVAGSHVLGEQFIQWYGTRKKKPKFPPKAEFEALVLTEKGLYHFDEDFSVSKVVNEWFAIGSGAHAALGALYAGKTLEEAVQISCKVDPWSGEPIQILRLNPEVSEK
jgi:hypothetical protein